MKQNPAFPITVKVPAGSVCPLTGVKVENDHVQILSGIDVPTFVAALLVTPTSGDPALDAVIRAKRRDDLAAQLLAAEVGTRGYYRVSANDVAGVVKLADALLLELAK